MFDMNDQLNRFEVKTKEWYGARFVGLVELRSAERVANRKRSDLNFRLS